MNESQRKLVLWVTISVCLLLTVIVGFLAFAGFHYTAAYHGDVFDLVVYENHLRWIVPLLVVLFGLLLIGGGALLRVGPAEVIDSTREDRINSFVKRLSTRSKNEPLTGRPISRDNAERILEVRI